MRPASSGAPVAGALALLGAADRSRPAHVLRRLVHRWAPVVPGALEGRSALVAGATSPFGLAVAAGLARGGARLVLVDEPGDALEEAARTVSVATSTPAVEAVAVGTVGPWLASRADELVARVGPLDVVVLPAGPDRPGSDPADLPFALTAALLASLRPASRVLWVATGRRRAELAELARGWAARLAPRGVAVHVVDPGAVPSGMFDAGRRTPLGWRGVGWPPRTPAQAVDTVLWLATSPAAGEAGGGLWLDRGLRPLPVGGGVGRRGDDRFAAAAARTGTTGLVPPPPDGEP